MRKKKGASPLKILTIANQKGGISKTTTAFNLAASLMRERRRVLLIDLDPQGDLSFEAQAVEGASMSEVVNGETNIKDAIQTTASGIDIIPANLSLIGTANEAFEFDFTPLAKAYDFVVIDCPPNQSAHTLAAIRAASLVLIPATADMFSFKSIQAMHDSIQDLGGKESRIIITRYAPRMVISKQVSADIEALAEQVGAKLYATKIRECVAVRESQLAQISIFDYDARSTAAEDYVSLTQEILEEE